MNITHLKSTLVILQCICFTLGLSAQNKKENTGYSSLITIEKNIRYAEKPAFAEKDTSSDRLLDLYLPKQKIKSKLPVYVYIHGGGFSGGDKSQRVDFCSKLAADGIAVVSVNYRLYLKHNKIKGASCSANMSKGLPESGKFNEGLQQAIKIAGEDASLALTWVKDNAKKYHLDTKKVTLSGGSAGAITALYTGLCTNPPINVKSIINMWGGVENNNQIINPKIPVLTFHGDKDALIAVDYARSLHTFLEEKGNKSSRLVIMEGVGHGGPAYKEVWNKHMDMIADFVKSGK